MVRRTPSSTQEKTLVPYTTLFRSGEAEGTTKAGLQAEKSEQIPLIHLVFSNLKTWIQGTHHGVSPKHLPAYLNEYVFRFNRRFYPMSGFHSVLGIAMEVEGTEYEDVYGNGEYPNTEEQWGFGSD